MIGEIHKAPKAAWPLAEPRLDSAAMRQIEARIEALASAAQYGWGHTIQIGTFHKKGLLGDAYLRIAGALDAWGWWPQDLTGATVADVGCYTGGLSLYLASRHPATVHAIDEIPEHIAQCEFLASLYAADNIKTHTASIYQLTEIIPEHSLDLVLVSGVLYHLSDMLVGLHILHRLLKPGGTLIIESNGVNDPQHSYANFGRFYAGMWWQPTGLCISDMCEFMEFENAEVRFYETSRCLARATATGREPSFKRGMNWRFESMRDARDRGMDPMVMAPAPRA